MKGVTLAIYILGILSFYNDSLAQLTNQTLHGNDGLIYQFETETFKTETRYPGIRSKKKISKGTFRIHGDTLILNYIAFKNPPSPSFKIINRIPILNIATFDSSLVDSSLYVHFNIVGENDRPIHPAPILHISNVNNKTIHGFQADSTGNIPEIFIFGKSDLFFKFTSIINGALVLNADTLMGYKSTVKVTLPKRIEYRDYGGMEKYLIKHSSGDIIELRSLDGDKTVQLESIK